jgi:CRISPR-associated protein Cas1
MFGVVFDCGWFYFWIWVIQQKITNKANTHKHFDKPFMRLEKLTNEVKSGDSTNCEGLAAQYYWKALFGKDFVRDQNADGVNSILNYGYSIIRAMIARSIVASGLHPAIGLFHHNQYNGLCLADDLMEPFRPWVDSIAYQLYQENTNIDITKETKIPFLNLMSESVTFKNKQMPLMVSVHYLMADLKRNFAKESKKIVYPKK